uniref:Uncharacterized protein n=2 Tax=viral metagenome TaxID=1070528 RepID=A0A6H1ZXX8_9ZZZZ
MDSTYMANEDQMSTFNSALATLERIHQIKQGLDIATVREDYVMKYKFLKAYFLELISVISPKDEKEMRPTLKKVTDNYYKLREILAMEGGKKVMKIPRVLIESFDLWESDLRNLEQRYGMNIPKTADARFALSSKR